MPRKFTDAEVIDSFWNKVRKGGFDDCWEWIAAKNQYGYGRFYNGTKGTIVRAHAFSYEFYYGTIKDGLHVLHECDNPPCCNPWHLFLGNQTTNMEDKFIKGRQAKGNKIPQCKVNEKRVLQIREMYQTGNYSYLQLGNIFGLSTSGVYHIVSRNRWKHILTGEDK